MPMSEPKHLGAFEGKYKIEIAASFGPFNYRLSDKNTLGGFGTYELITRRPDWFAAAMPLCGGGDETKAASIAKVPIWIFHGEKDEAVKVTASRNMVEALKAAGGQRKRGQAPFVRRHPSGLQAKGA